MLAWGLHKESAERKLPKEIESWNMFAKRPTALFFVAFGIAAGALTAQPQAADAQERRIDLPLGGTDTAANTDTTLENYVKTKWPIGRGSEGKAVKELQNRLKKLGYKVRPDGVFGLQTLKALRKFQRETGLEDDGFFGKATLRILKHAEKVANVEEVHDEESTPVDQPPTSTVGLTGALRGDTQTASSRLLSSANDGAVFRPGSRGSQVKEIQGALAKAGFPVSNSGYYGYKTTDAVKEFQRSKGLKADGRVGPQTAALLFPDSSFNETMASTDWLQIAHSQLGVREASGSRNNPIIVAYHRTAIGGVADSVPWCASFVNWCVKKANINGTNKGNARSWLDWGRKISKPVPGCVVVFWRSSPASWKGHVGFYVGDAASYVKVLGGNQGNAVTISTYPKSRVLGYRWPSNVPLPGAPN
jgi:uncharacterized protein (TIGR02594 family)